VTSIAYFVEHVCLNDIEHILNQDENETNRITVMPKQIEAFNKFVFLVCLYALFYKKEPYKKQY